MTSVSDYHVSKLFERVTDEKKYLLPSKGEEYKFVNNCIYELNTKYPGSLVQCTERDHSKVCFEVSRLVYNGDETSKMVLRPPKKANIKYKNRINSSYAVIPIEYTITEENGYKIIEPSKILDLCHMNLEWLDIPEFKKFKLLNSKYIYASGFIYELPLTPDEFAWLYYKYNNKEDINKLLDAFDNRKLDDFEYDEFPKELFFGS